MIIPSRRWTPFAANLVWMTVGPWIGTAAADDVQVNTSTTGSQRSAAIALDADGDFVVVWQSPSSGGTDPGTSSQGQRYASDGSAAGGEFQVNTYTTGNQTRAAVSLDSDGDFVVVWQSTGSSSTDSDSTSVQGQRYAADGSAIGGEFQVNTYTTGSQRYPAVSLDADGDFVVVWESGGSSGTDSSGLSVQGQRYAADGSAIGGEFQVNTYTTSSQNRPSVSLDTDGDFVVVWYSDGSSGMDASGFSIQGQRYASSGSIVGTEFQINTYYAYNQVFPSVSLDADGDFVVAWESAGSSGTDFGLSVQGQRYASDGSTAGGEFQVNTTIASSQQGAAVSLDADGDFVIAWQSNGSSGTDSSSFSIQIQRYASDGSAIGGEFQVNTYTYSYQHYPSVSLDADGEFVVVWESNGSGGGSDSDGISIQKSEADTVPVELTSFTVE